MVWFFRTVFGVALVPILISIAPHPGFSEPSGSRRADPGLADTSDDQPYIEYQLRANEDPSKVARMFHVSIEDLLTLNKISDPRRLTVGATLKIPDPRLQLVQQLREEKKTVTQQLAAAQADAATAQRSVQELRAQVADLRDTNEELRGQQALYHALRAAVAISGGTAVVLALAVFIAWAKSRDAERRHQAALRKADVLQTALEKYRQLSAQFELKYQSLFHQVGMPAPTQARAQALRAAFDEDRARLDAIVNEAEREIKGAVAELVRDRRMRAGKAALASLAAARKSG